MPLSRNYALGKGSLAHIATTSPMMQTLCHKAMEISNTRKLHCPDWGVTCGYRSEDEQFTLFKLGRIYNKKTNKWTVYDLTSVVTNCDGIQIRSVHQDKNAIDIYVVGDNEYDPAWCGSSKYHPY